VKTITEEALSMTTTVDLAILDPRRLEEAVGKALEDPAVLLVVVDAAASRDDDGFPDNDGDPRRLPRHRRAGRRRGGRGCVVGSMVA